MSRKIFIFLAVILLTGTLAGGYAVAQGAFLSAPGFHISELITQPLTSRDWGIFGSRTAPGLDIVAGVQWRFIPASNDTYRPPAATLDTAGNLSLAGNIAAGDFNGVHLTAQTLTLTGAATIDGLVTINQTLNAHRLTLGPAGFPSFAVMTDDGSRGAPMIIYNPTDGVWMLRHNNGFFSKITTEATDSAGGGGGGGLSDDSVLESHLKVVDAATDEECLTFESTVGDFEWQSCAASTTLQNAYDNGNTITTTDARDIDITLADTTTDSKLTIDIAGTGNTFEVQDAGIPVFSVADGGTSFFQTTTDSTTGFQFLDADGGTPILNVDTTNERVGVGTNAPGSKLHIDDSGHDLRWSVVDNVTHTLPDGSPLLRLESSGSTLGTGLSFRSGTLDWVIGLTDESTGQLRIDRENTALLFIDSSGLVGIGASPTARLQLAGNQTANAWGTTGIHLDAASATFTDDSTAGSGTAASAVFNSFQIPTLAATNTSVTTTDAATVYIAGAPAAGTNQTITNPYALWVDAGDVRIDGNLVQNSGTGEAFVQGGNSFGALATLGTNDANNLALETNNTTRLTLDTSGHLTPNADDTYDLGSDTNRFRDLYLGPSTLHIGASGDESQITYNTTSDLLTFQNSVDSTTGFQFLDADGGTPILNVDTTNERVGVGVTDPSTTLQAAGTLTLGDSNNALGLLRFENAANTNAAEIQVSNQGDLVLAPGNNAIDGVRTVGGRGSIVINDTNDLEAGLVRLLVKGTASQTGDYVRFEDSSGTGVAVIDASGRLGIGTTAPSELLTLGDTGNILLEGGYFTSPFGGFGRYENHLGRSEEFNSASWTKTGGVTVTADATAAPDGATTADQITDDATGGGTIENQGITAGASEDWTFSVWIKDNDTTGNISIEIKDDQAGTTTTTIDPTTSWRRYSVTHNTNASTTAVDAIINHDSTASNSFYAWGAQFEQQSGPGVYVRTKASTINTTQRGLVAQASDYHRLSGVLQIDGPATNSRIVIEASGRGGNRGVKFLQEANQPFRIVPADGSASFAGLKLEPNSAGTTALEIAPSNDLIGLKLTGASGQTQDLIQIDDNGGSRLLTLDSSGQVGIGTASPGEGLTLGDGAGTLRNILLSKENVATSTTQHPSNDLILQGSVWDETNTAAEDRTLTFRTIAGSGADGSEPYRLGILDNAGTEFVSFDGLNQRVGIGTSTPASGLHIKQGGQSDIYGIRVEDSVSSAAINIYQGCCGIQHIKFAHDFEIGHTGAVAQPGVVQAGRNLTLKTFDDANTGNILFDIGGTEVARFDTDNNHFGIGTSNPGTKLEVNGIISNSVQSVTIADTADANPATHTLTPSSSYIEITCNDADTCDITMDETGAVQGSMVTIINVSANVVDFADTAGVSELAGAFAAGQWDVISLRYASDRWIEVGRSNN